ncbi:hypothetical protein AB6A40_003843 [Gnathostoma spinigerum]|uniref:receptor protein serine/threonine kinase n=1 Tax=Gnathostoma spinigerum TaxID=75299 RepID=A0ABD6EIG7_9BILA
MYTYISPVYINRLQVFSERPQFDDEAEHYDEDGDLVFPNDAVGVPVQSSSRRLDSEDDRRRKNAPAKYEDERSLCYCNYSPEVCGGFTNFTCIKHIEAACFHFMRETFNEEIRRMETLHLYGCAPLTRGSGGSYFTCKAYLVAHASPKSIACCYEGNYCNRNLTVPAYANISPEHEDLDGRLTGGSFVYLWLIVAVMTTLSLIFLAFFYLFKKAAPLKIEITDRMGSKISLGSDTADAEKAPILHDISSGSGSGSASLNQRTVAQELQMIEVIGKGRYGEVKKALYRGDRVVAVKTFYTTEEDSWKNEKEIYQTQMLNHENILQFVAADIGSDDSITRMMLITDFHRHGSLFDYLQRGETLSVDEALRLAHSAVCGLEHLHTSLRGTGSPQKPGIAHRDIKSQNIIVKRPGVCCIADFGLALSEDMVKNNWENINVQVGTKRYMAPEVLDNSLNVRNFHHFRMADIYSFSLVIWEILRRIQEDSVTEYSRSSDSGIDSDGILPIGSVAILAACNTLRFTRQTEPADAHITACNISRISKQADNNMTKLDDNSKSVTARPAVPPFDGLVGSDPTCDQMRNLVCDKKQRPALEESWKKDPCLSDVCKLMQECWHENISCRHTALRIKRILKRTQEKHLKSITDPNFLQTYSTVNGISSPPIS